MEGLRPATIVAEEENFRIPIERLLLRGIERVVSFETGKQQQQPYSEPAVFGVSALGHCVGPVIGNEIVFRCVEKSFRSVA